MKALIYITILSADAVISPLFGVGLVFAVLVGATWWVSRDKKGGDDE